VAITGEAIEEPAPFAYQVSRESDSEGTANTPAGAAVAGTDLISPVNSSSDCVRESDKSQSRESESNQTSSRESETVKPSGAILEQQSEKSSSLSAGSTARESEDEIVTEKSGNGFNKYKYRVVEHVVRRGDTLWDLARIHGTSIADICSRNGIDEKDALISGKVLKIRKKEKLSFYTVSSGDTLSTIAKRLDTSVRTLQYLNNIRNADRLRVGQRLCIATEGLLDWPLSSHRISSGYGMRVHPIYRTVMLHRGVDFAARRGSQIAAAADGEVVFAGWQGKSGYLVKLRHNSRVETIYAHCSKILVKKGEKISKGKTIALVGSTGLSTGPHLHFGVKVNRKYVNPVKYF
jgi:LysM repeat protein